MQTDRQSIAAAVGKIPSGCAILTVEHEGESTGLLVSWIQQASFEPLLITVCIKRGRPASALITNAQRFTLNIVGDEPSAMFRHFGRGFAPDEDAFAGLRTRSSEYGPVLPDCAAHLGCRVVKTVEVGDHVLYVAEVLAAATSGPRKPYVHVRSSALSY